MLISLLHFTHLIARQAVSIIWQSCSDTTFIFRRSAYNMHRAGLTQLVKNSTLVLFFPPAKSISLTRVTCSWWLNTGSHIHDLLYHLNETGLARHVWLKCLPGMNHRRTTKLVFASWFEEVTPAGNSKWTFPSPHAYDQVLQPNQSVSVVLLLL